MMLGTENILFVGSYWAWQALLFSMLLPCATMSERGEIILHLQAASMAIKLIDLCQISRYFSSRYVIVCRKK